MLRAEALELGRVLQATAREQGRGEVGRPRQLKALGVLTPAPRNETTWRWSSKR